jgi:hypothetical protein
MVCLLVAAVASGEVERRAAGAVRGVHVRAVLYEQLRAGGCKGA